jgi:hypothetical protein
MSSGVISVLQPIVIGVDAALAVALGVDDGVGLPLAGALAVSLGVGDDVGAQALRAASARAERATGTTTRLTMRRGTGMIHCRLPLLRAACNTPAR